MQDQSIPRFGNGRGGIGAASELTVAADLFRRGYYVFRALSPNGPFDLIAVDGEGQCLRIEVKTGTYLNSGGVTHPPLRHNRHDILGIVLFDGHIVYRPPFEATTENLAG